MIDQINIKIFTDINRFAGESALLDKIAIDIAEYSPYVFIAVLFYLWFSSMKDGKYYALTAGYSAILGILINRSITLFYFHPRPFMQEIGTQLVYHVPESSFPSDHTTFMLSIAAMLLYFRSTVTIGCLLFFFGLLSGGSRVFCGVHFPVDIIGSVLVSLIVASTVWGLRKRLRVLNDLIINVYYRILFRKKLYTPNKQELKSVVNNKE
ncbi:MAG: undecaprenyl-diphosphatase [Candidatus Scalindua sp.]|nr:undecaprenyl-diphosphatase [Candidatus Scalindua sp.]MDV5167318.1 undecaprenyl-diphosphatase [Candidatus Scalindua sp.]